ncbi:MAG: T9SS type A sorting domain-containing protein [Bacteroidetes bacterium]|nr:T9SS type A sorting domain-containing protein [Bacteroidota bacterium]
MTKTQDYHQKQTPIRIIKIAFFFLFAFAIESQAGFKYSQARFFQNTGTVNLGSTNQQILWGQIDGTTTTFVGGWGISSLSFTMANSDNANVLKAKIWYNTVNDFATATLKDSISNPSGTIAFNIADVDSLELVSVYFFLTYDIAATGCNGNVLDATIPSGGITVIGNVAGLKSPISGSNPSGNRTISTTAIVPSVSILPSSNLVIPGTNVTLTPTPVNGGANPIYTWYVNGINTATTSGDFVLNSITTATTVYCVMTSNLACVSPLTATSSTKTINVQGYKYSASTFYQVTGTVALGAKNQQIIYAKFDGASTTTAGGWGVSSLAFGMNNTNDATVTKAKLWYNTVNDFATATLKDSISNPSGTIVFSIPGVSNLELTSVYFFLTYDIAESGCNNNVLDATVPASSITITGNIAGIKTATSLSLSGNRTIATASFAPAINVATSSSSVPSGGSVTLTPTPTNGGSNPTYAWYVNGVLTATNSGAYTITNITATTTAYCIMTSNLPCVSPVTVTSATKTISVGGYKYGASTFYQVSGNVLWGAKNQQILYGKFDGAVSTASGGWGVSSLSFVTVNTDNANVTKAKLWYNTVNDFSTAILKDSISNPSGTITFNVPGVSNLDMTSVYFFLTYDVATLATCGNTLDASLPPSAINVIGNIAGLKSVTSGANPSGNRVISTAVLTPSVTVVTSSSSVISGGSATITPTPVNGGSAPSYVWYVNGSLFTTNSGALTLTNITSTTTVYCIMTSNLLCVSPTTATSVTKTISVQGYKYSASTFYQVLGTVAPGSKHNQILYGKFDAATSNNSGGWGVSALKFNMTSFNNANIAKAKLWFNTVNDFSTATLKDSVSNPTGVITFNIGGVSNLGAGSVYFFLTYDMAFSGVCSGNIIDASVASNGITIVGNIAGQKSVTSGSNPTGYLTVSTVSTPASVSIAASANSVVSGGSVTFTPSPVNGGSNPTYNWYVNNVLTTTNNGAFTLTNITVQSNVYCKMISNLACSNAQLTSNTKNVTVTIAGYQYGSSTFYQVSGTVVPGAKNQQIMYGKLDGAPSAFTGGWGVSGLSFAMANSSNTDVLAAKLYYNTVNDFSTAILKDSIANPFGTINFSIAGISNLGLGSVYFFLAYDVAASGPCNGNILDASVPLNGINISGNIAGPKSVTTDANPVGSRTVVASPIVPSVSITENVNNVTPGSSVILTPHPVNGGANPSYAWYVNGVYTTSTTGSYELSNLLHQTTVYCIMTSDLVCAVPQSISSGIKTIIVQGYKYGSSTFYQASGSVVPGAVNQQIIYGKLDGAATTAPNGWGVNQLSFIMSNSNNANVTAAKLWYNTSNDFASATLKDSIANPSGTITFSVAGVSNLELGSVYFFLTYDIAADGVCDGNELDAVVATNGIAINGNIAGNYSVTTDANPAGNRIISSTVLVPSVSISSNKTTVTAGNAAVFTASAVNGGNSPSFDWYVNGIMMATTSGTFTLTNITSTVNVYCVMTSDLMCVSEATATSAIQTVSITNAKYLQSRFYQVTGTLNPGAKNQQIMWGQFDGGTTNNIGGWGVSQIKFNMNNSNNAAVTAAKLYFNTVNDFATATLKDSIANPAGTITFNIGGVSNLDLDSYYFFLAYDISPAICAGNTFDASIPTSAITVVGNVAGLKTPVSGTNPSGNRSFSGTALVPSVTLTTSGTSTCVGYPVTFTPNPVNGGSNPSYQWFVNNVSVGTTTGDFVVSNLTNQAKVYCVMTSNLPCVSTPTATSATKTITVSSFSASITITGPNSVVEGTTANFSATVLNGGSLPTYQWFRNGIALPGATKSTMFTDFAVSGDKITCRVTSNKSCTSPITATSNEIVVSTQSKSRSAAILDFSARNGETFQNNLFSAKHIMDVAGIPYIVSSSLDVVQNYPMILCTSWLDSVAFTAYEDSVISNYVKHGGVIILPRMKNNDIKFVFGVNGYFSSTTRYQMSWNMGSNDASLRWFDDTLEQKISLGRNNNPSIFDTRSYSLTTATPLAFYEDGNVAITKNHYHNGYAYALGMSLKDLVLRPQLNLDYNAQRTFSNGFEPSTDVFIFWIKALYAQYVPNAVWKHTSPGDTKATIMMTHDIDAATSCLLMPANADYEDSLNIRATYFITTHYIHDFVAGDFWTGYTPQRQYLLSKNMEVASHSVGHFPDMDIESIVAIGAPGNTVTNYLPHYNGNFTVGASVYGEVEVSKSLLDTDLGISIESYRPGYLYQHNQQINAMKDLGYKYSSSMSGNDVLTAFPYLAHKDMVFEGDVTDLLEIPMTISDAQVSDKVDSANYPRHVSRWLYCVEKNLANGAPTNLLIHPTRDFKLWAERLFVSQLPNGLTFRTVKEYGEYWKMRNNVSYTTTINASNVMTIVIPSMYLPLSNDFSIVIDNGQNLAAIQVKDENGNTIEMEHVNWLDNGVLLFGETPDGDGDRQSFVSGKAVVKKKAKAEVADIYTRCYPNPFIAETNIVYLLKTKADVTLEIFNVFGEKVQTLVNTTEAEGIHQVLFNAKGMAAGVYYYELTVDGKRKMEKIVLTE